MCPEYEIRFLKPGEEKKLIELLNQGFKGWPHFDLQCDPLEHWQWKNKGNPFGESKVIVADSGGDLVGCLGLNLNSLKIGSKTFLCTQSVDATVLQNHREFGVFSKIRAMSDDAYSKGEIGVHYGVSSNPYVTKAVYKVDPQRHPIPLSFMIKISDIDSYTKSFKATKKVLVTSGYHGAKLLNALRRSGKAKVGESAPGLTIYEVKEFDDRIDEFWGEIKESYNLIQTLTPEYLNWRFCDPRGGNYIIRQVEEDGKITGFSALRINKYGGDPPCGFIVALYGLRGKIDYVRALLDDALGYFQEQGINTVKFCINKGHPYEDMFRDRGFVVSPSEAHFTTVAKNIGDDYEEYKTSPIEKVLFQYGSFDWI